VGDLKFGCGNQPITGAVYSFQTKLLIVDEIYFCIHSSRRFVINTTKNFNHKWCSPYMENVW